MLLVILAGLGYGGYEVVRAQLDSDDRRATVEQFVQAWEKGDYEAMYALLDAPSRKANPRISFLADYRRANRSATVEKVTIGRVGPLLADGRVRVPVTVTTKVFGRLEGTLTFKAAETEDGVTLVAWAREQRLPGLRKGEEVRRKSGTQPSRGNIYAAGGKLLNSDALGASIAGAAGKKPTGLERLYDDRLGGARSSTLRFGDRVIARVEGQRGRSIATTIRLGLQRTAQNALGERLGGIAVIKPSDGSVLALAGLAVSAPQPPGSSFKIITAAAALQHGVAKSQQLVPRAHRRDALGRQAPQRRRRVVRRQPLELVRALLRLRLRAARREARRQAARRGRRALRLQRAARGPRGQEEHDPEGRGPARQPGRRRERDRSGQGPRDPASRWPRWRRRSPTRACASTPGWRAAATRASASSAPRSPARCAT